MESSCSMDIGVRIILDIIDIIKKAKNRIAEQNTIFREAEAFGLGYDDTTYFL